MCVHVKQTKTGVMLKHRRLSDSCWCYFSSRHQNERSATKTLGDVQTMFRRRSDDVTVFLKNRFLVVTTTKRQKKQNRFTTKKKCQGNRMDAASFLFWSQLFCLHRSIWHKQSFNIRLTLHEQTLKPGYVLRFD